MADERREVEVILSAWVWLATGLGDGLFAWPLVLFSAF